MPVATPTHTPLGRGFDTCLCYFHHGNSYWDQGTGDLTCPVGIDLWDGQEGAAHSLWSPVANDNGMKNGSTYEEKLFRDRFMHIVAQHDPAAAPLFLYYAPHLVHDPLMVPQEYLDMMSIAGGGPFDNESDTSSHLAERMTYHAMVKALDDQIGNLTAAVKAKNGMWEQTLLWCECPVVLPRDFFFFRLYSKAKCVGAIVLSL